MKTIYICSLDSYSGKSLICLGLGMKLKEKNKKIGYLKPFGNFPISSKHGIIDEDVLLISEALDFKDPLSLICPILLDEQLVEKNFAEKNLSKENYFSKIINSFTEISKNKDFMLITGASSFLTDGFFLDIPDFKIAKKLNAEIIFIAKYTSSFVIDQILFVKEFLKKDLLGVIINGVPYNKLSYAKEMYFDYLKEKDINLLGIMPEEPFFKYISIQELQEKIGGKILCADEKKNELIEHFSVGAMDAENALKHFRKITNKAVITGGDRSDIQLAALETSTKCLILSGGFQPSSLILSRAIELKIPIIVVEQDTLSIVEQIEKSVGKVRIKEKEKIQKVIQLVNEHIAFDKIID
ncbi:MAG: phosphotransacetylase family protein [bacterium]